MRVRETASLPWQTLRVRLALVLGCVWLGAASRVLAQAPPIDEADAGRAPAMDAGAPRDESEMAEPTGAIDAGAFESTTRARRGRARDEGTRGRSGSRVEREDLEERLPRSSPDALRYEPGVYVQQTAHGQGSAYIRGLTGQQTVIVYDDIRMNTSVYRQGPNQYFFTVDAQTLDSIEVLRGSSSVFYGTDAIGGVLLASPFEPRRDPNEHGLVLAPRGGLRLSTSDHGGGFRLQLESQLGPRLTAIFGSGYRHFGLLESGGVVRGLEGDASGHEVGARVPTFLEDRRTMRGTGFGELTADARVRYQLTRRLSVTGALYAYRQFDAPRTDQCPAPFAPADECLSYQEQFHTIASLALRGAAGPLHDIHVALSYQQQHERRLREQPSLLAETVGLDDIDTFGVTARTTSPSLRVAPAATMRATVGLDLYHDEVASRSTLYFTDIGVARPRSRGQYLDGSRYTNAGPFGQLELRLADQVTVRAGMRGGFAVAYAPADELSGSSAVDRHFEAFVARIGAEWTLLPWLTLLANADDGFRAPNLDDLTSRQQTGPGFQFENATLRPERSRTFEGGARLSSDALSLEAWLFRTAIRDTIVRELRSVQDCPPETPQCNSSWSRIQLVNAAGEARLWGFEAWARASVPGGLHLRASLSYAFGDVPSQTLESTRVPLSRVPPLNGSVELRWDPPWIRPAAYVGAAVRWALDQTRLAPSDLKDGRIPLGGTPGYAVLDLRAGARLNRFLVLSLVVENLFDAAYRVHGSSVNGPGRGLVVALEGGL